jgi:hypothetical protein
VSLEAYFQTAIHLLEPYPAATEQI